MNSKKSISSSADILAEYVEAGEPRAFDLDVRADSGIFSYKRHRFISRCCRVERDREGQVVRIEIVAQGDNGWGPFLFVWHPNGSDAINPNQPACRGMLLVQASIHPVS